METTIKVSLLTMLAEKTEVLTNVVFDYLVKHNFVLPDYETKPNQDGKVLKGNYIPMNSIVRLSEEYLEELNKLEFNEYDKLTFHSFTITGNKKSYRCNLSINNKGRFGCSLIPISVSQIQLQESDLVNNNSEVITIG
ncbi:hypothetical protein [Immundisolibacter sp.]